MQEKIYPFGERTWKLAILFLFMAACTIGFSLIALSDPRAPAWNGFDPEGWGVLLAKSFIGLLAILSFLLFLMVIYKIYLKFTRKLKLTLGPDSIAFPVGLKDISYVTIPYNQINMLKMYYVNKTSLLLGIHHNNTETVLTKIMLPNNKIFEKIALHLAKMSGRNIE